ncbi:MAG: hypothetical protein U0169_25645 [Polyangiaceae bacterium]
MANVSEWSRRLVVVAALIATATGCGTAADVDSGSSSAAAGTSKLASLLTTLRAANRAAEAEAKPLRGAGRALLDELATASKGADEVALATSLKSLFGHALPADVSARQWIEAMTVALGSGKAPKTAEETLRAVMADHTLVAILENVDDLASVLRSQGARDTGIYELMLAAMWRIDRDVDAAGTGASNGAERLLSRPADSRLRELGAASGLDAKALDRVANLVDDVADVRRAPYSQAGKMLRFVESNAVAGLTFESGVARGPMLAVAERAAGGDVKALATMLVQLAESAAVLRRESGFGAALLRKTKGFREMELRAERTHRALLRVFGEEKAAALALADTTGDLVGVLGTRASTLRTTKELLTLLADDFASSYELVLSELQHVRHGDKHLSPLVATVDDAKRVAKGSEGQYLPEFHDDAARAALEKTAILTGIRDPHGGADYFWFRAAKAVGAGEDGELTRWIRVEVASGLAVHSHPRPYAQLPTRVKDVAVRLDLGP